MMGIGLGELSSNGHMITAVMLNQYKSAIASIPVHFPYHGAWVLCERKTIPSAYVKIAIENGHKDS